MEHEMVHLIVTGYLVVTYERFIPYWAKLIIFDLIKI